MDTFVLVNHLPQKIEGILVDFGNKESLGEIRRMCDDMGYNVEIVHGNGLFTEQKMKIFKGKECAVGHNQEDYLVKYPLSLRFVPKSLIEVNYRKI